MSWAIKDIKPIVPHIVVTLVAISLCAAIVYGGLWLNDQAQMRYNAESAATTEAEAHADAAVLDRANVQTYQSAMNNLRQRNIIGSEQRLPWVEYFTRLNATGNPADLSLKLEPRRPLEDAPATPEPLENLLFYASKLTLNAKLLHEGDALRLLKQLHEVQGAAIVRQCNIKRSEGSNSPRPYLLELECSGDVVTLDKPVAAVAPQ